MNLNDMGVETIGGIPATKENYRALLRAYRKARKENAEKFEFMEHEWITDYIMYVLELMRNKLGIKLKKK